jgi:hypothetical protein
VEKEQQLLFKQIKTLNSLLKKGYPHYGVVPVKN